MNNENNQQLQNVIPNRRDGNPDNLHQRNMNPFNLVAFPQQRGNPWLNLINQRREQAENEANEQMGRRPSLLGG